MKYLKFISICLMAIITVSLVACSNDDEPATEGDLPPTALFGTWNMDNGATITFYENKTGEITMQEEDTAASSLSSVQTKSRNAASNITVHFTWNYRAADKQLTIDIQGEKRIWTIIELTNEDFVIVDEDGDRIYMERTDNQLPDTPKNPDDNKVGRTEWLYATWGIAGQKVYEFTPNSIIFHYKNEMTGETASEACPAYYDEDTHVIYFQEMENEPYSVLATVTELTPTLIRLQGGVRGSFSRINDDDVYTVGPLSLLYDKELSMIGYAGTSLVIKSDGILRMGGMTLNYTYDEDTHVLKTYFEEGNGHREYVHDLKIFQLTEDVLFCESRHMDNGVQESTLMEFRVL